MPAVNSVPDLLEPTREVHAEEIIYRFANGLTIKTEVLHKADELRILPLGTPQGALMNHLLNFPETVRGKQVLEPFAGSGALGFMALKAGARHVDFLDINPRAVDFQRQNAALNRLSPERFTAIQGDISDFAPPRRYDLILANPPFLPTPEGLAGSLTSNGGPEGNRLVEVLLRRLEEFLAPRGQALVYVFQLVKDRRPLVVALLRDTAGRRSVELTSAQERGIPFASYRDAYVRLFPRARREIDLWRADLFRRHGDDLTLGHYVVDIGPQAGLPTACVVRDNFAEKFGRSFLVPSENPQALAFGRISENWVPAPDTGGAI